MYLSTAAAAFLPIGTHVSSPPLRRIRRRRCARNTSFNESSLGSYRRPANPDTRSPVSIKIRMMAISRRSTNEAPEHVLSNRASSSSLKNAAGKFVEPNTKSFQAAADTADWANAKDFNLLMTNAPGDSAWPITATTWIIMYKQPKNAEQAQAAFHFFKWSLENGQQQAAALDYVALPESLVKRIEGYWKSDFAR